jgi:extracellular factor (EF) 3-hydroxypalmitic acid methyl ester biosynthesis protein
VRKSVAQVLRGKSHKPDGAVPQKFDFIYCAGLFDYLTDAVCKQLMNMLFDVLAPGGLLVATNVDGANPIRHWLGTILEWHLVYRDGRQFLALRPDEAELERTSVRSDMTGVNIFLEVRRNSA